MMISSKFIQLSPAAAAAAAAAAADAAAAAAAAARAGQPAAPNKHRRQCQRTIRIRQSAGAAPQRIFKLHCKHITSKPTIGLFLDSTSITATSNCARECSCCGISCPWCICYVSVTENTENRCRCLNCRASLMQGLVALDDRGGLGRQEFRL